MDEIKKNVLYISYDGMTDPLGQSQVLPYIFGLSKNGYVFHLISFEKPDRFVKLKDDIQVLCDKNNITWHPKIYTKKPPLLSTLYDVWRMRKLSFKLNKTHQFSIVHCRSYLSAMVGLAMKKKFKTKFLFDMRGFWADERVDGNIWNLKNPVFKVVYKFFKSQELKFLIHSDQIVSLTHSGKKEMCNWLDLNDLAEKITVIPCCTDLDLFKPMDRDSDQFTIGYLGSLGTWYMLTEMLQVYKMILKQIPNAKFHFLTKDDPNLVYKEAQVLDLDCAKILVEESSRNEIPEKTKNWDFSIFFIKASYSKISSSPTKQGELMGLGIPIICNSGVGDVDQIVKKYNSGIVVNLEKDLDLEIKKHSLTDKFSLHNNAHDVFSLKKGIELYNSIYFKL